MNWSVEKSCLTSNTLVLSTAYNTLIQPSTKLSYDMKYKAMDVTQFACEENNAVDVFEQVIRQVCAFKK